MVPWEESVVPITWEESVVPISSLVLVAPPTAEPQVTENNPAAVVAVCKKKLSD